MTAYHGLDIVNWSSELMNLAVKRPRTTSGWLLVRAYVDDGNRCVDRCYGHDSNWFATTRIAAVFQHIDMHLDERLSIQALANTVGLSPCYFAHAFKRSTGLSPHDYLVQRRVQRVEELLSETDLPISEIAFAVFFADQSHCGRRFRERIGLTPGEYRWSMR
jgi:AraC family transcriptional regulator